MNFLLDTNALIYLQNGKLVTPLPDGVYAYSVISAIELLSWPQIQPDGERVWRGFLSELQRIDLDAAVRESTIILCRQQRLKLPDAIIAASAQVYDATLLTNDQQLLNVPGLRSQSLAVRSG